MISLSLDWLIENDISDFSSLDKYELLGSSMINSPHLALSTVVVAVTCDVPDFILGDSGIDSLIETVVFEELVSSAVMFLKKNCDPIVECTSFSIESLSTTSCNGAVTFEPKLLVLSSMFIPEMDLTVVGTTIMAIKDFTTLCVHDKKVCHLILIITNLNK